MSALGGAFTTVRRESSEGHRCFDIIWRIWRLSRAKWVGRGWRTRGLCVARPSVVLCHGGKEEECNSLSRLLPPSFLPSLAIQSLPRGRTEALQQKVLLVAHTPPERGGGRRDIPVFAHWYSPPFAFFLRLLLPPPKEEPQPSAE